MATVQFMKMMITMTDADIDQQHIPMLVANCPQIPDRTSFILDNTKADPVLPMIEAGRFLSRSGAAEIAIPCITAHSFHDEMQEALDIPLINGVEETVRYLVQCGIEKAGIMATEGTVRTGLFSKALHKFGIEAVYPDEVHQKFVTGLIYRDVKAGRNPNIQELWRIQQHLTEQGAQVILLGCTELSVIDKSVISRSVFLDVMEVLARYCVKRFGSLKPEYEELLVPYENEDYS